MKCNQMLYFFYTEFILYKTYLMPWQYTHSAYATIQPAQYVLATLCLLRQFSTATPRHIYDTSSDLNIH
jgi:hypothetical protein